MAQQQVTEITMVEKITSIANELVDKQHELQVDILNQDIDSVEYFKYNSLALIDEIFELDTEIFIDLDKNLFDLIDEEYMDIVLFTLNIGLYFIKATKKPDAWLKEVIQDEIRLLNVFQFRISTYEQFKPTVYTLCKCVRDITRATPWKPWKKQQQFKEDLFIASYRFLVKNVLKTSRVTSLDLNKTFLDAYNSKREKVIARKNKGY